jgi:polysaccharide export outer membrane protein
VKFRSIHGRLFRYFMLGLFGFGLGACSNVQDAPTAAPQSVAESPGYLIGPGDQLQIFVWRNPELSTSVPVRPDGRISLPLIEDLQAANKTPTDLARDVEKVLAEFVQNPVVTVIVTNFVGPFDQQVRVVGEASEPRAIPYREKMTVLDVMIAVGGLTEFAAGNRAVIVRADNQAKTSYRVRLDDLLKDGDVSANVDVLPGDILIIPQSWF